MQSIALRLVVEREKEIEAHVPVEYWTIDADLAKKSAADQYRRFTARLVKIAETNVIFNSNGDKPPVLDGEATIRPHVDALQPKSICGGCSQTRDTPKPSGSRLSPPAHCSKPASNRRGLSARRTMRIAQQLYEGINIGGGNPVGLDHLHAHGQRPGLQAGGRGRARIYRCESRQGIHAR